MLRANAWYPVAIRTNLLTTGQPKFAVFDAEELTICRSAMMA